MMKKIFIVLVAALTIAACTKNDLGDFQDAKQEAFVKDFNGTFKVSAEDYKNHQWGMNTVPLVDITATRAAQPNGNQWGTHDDNDKYLNWPMPDPITTDELNAVLEVFNEKGEASYEPLVHWENFFVQQVYTGPNGSKMNELATTVDYEIVTNVISWWPYEAEVVRNTVTPFDDIINNFNAGNCTAWDGCMLMWNSATEDFSFKTSQGGGQRWYKHWRMEKINGNYYVGFDHESAKQGSEANNNELDVRDYIYNDWIIKIVPGEGSTPPDVERVRIMCEDLGDVTSDFDYNDVVFDVKFIKNGNKYTADIILQAAGGILPLYIGDKEVHDLFGVSEQVMVNTQHGKHSAKAPVHFTVTLPNREYNTAWDAINALPVVVITSTRQTVQLTVNPGKPAEMIAVPVTADWSDERIPIQDSYPTFVNWIKDPSVKWWE